MVPNIAHVEIDPGTTLDAKPHNGIPEESVFVLQGKVNIVVESQEFVIEQDNFIRFQADCTHRYQNSGSDSELLLSFDSDCRAAVTDRHPDDVPP